MWTLPKALVKSSLMMKSGLGIGSVHHTIFVSMYHRERRTAVAPMRQTVEATASGLKLPVSLLMRQTWILIHTFGTLLMALPPSTTNVLATSSCHSLFQESRPAVLFWSLEANNIRSSTRIWTIELRPVLLNLVTKIVRLVLDVCSKFPRRPAFLP